MNKRSVSDKPPQGQKELIAALHSWRQAEKEDAVVVLGLKLGNRDETEEASSRALHKLRIAYDKVFAPEPYKQMNPQTQKASVEALNRKVAEFMGWKFTESELGDYVNITKPGGRDTHMRFFPGQLDSLERMFYAGVPDYCNDLNAMHEAETWFMQNNELPAWNDYVSKLVDICGHNNPKPYRIKTVADFYCFAFHASARQRAEAFVNIMEAQSNHSV